MALPPSYVKAIAKLALRKRAQMQKFKKMKAGTFGGVFKAKDYPGALNLKRGMTRKGKPKLRIV
jgi:hypothetical protein